MLDDDDDDDDDELDDDDDEDEEELSINIVPSGLLRASGGMSSSISSVSAFESSSSDEVPIGIVALSSSSIASLSALILSLCLCARAAPRA